MKILINNINSLLIWGALLLFGSGCTKFLEETDPSNFTNESFFKTPVQAESAVNSIYQSLRDIRGGGYNGAPWLMLEFQTGLANTELGQAQNSLIIRDLVNNSDNGYGITHWNSSYRGIANANLAIAKIPEINMDENLKKKLLGEARFLRAYNYYNLVRIFGMVPLILEPVDLNSPLLYPVQASVDDIYSLIVDDLMTAETSGLPLNDISGRVTLGAVKSLLSSVYLTMAGYPLQKGAAYYQKAADKAKEVIDSGVYSLFTSYDDLHDPAKKNVGENIFMVQYAAFIAPSDWQVLIVPYNQNVSAYSDQTGAIFAEQKFVESYEPGDKRVEEKQFYFHYFTLKADRSVTINLGGYYLYKLFDVEANLKTASSGLNWALLRYAEVLFIYAEASNEFNGPSPDAYEAINEIRRRAELPELSGLNKEEFREAIWREKWHEMSYENKTWFDMVRVRKGFNLETKRFDDYIGYHFVNGPILKERELLFPIPTDEIRNNKNLIQNPGY